MKVKDLSKKMKYFVIIDGRKSINITQEVADFGADGVDPAVTASNILENYRDANPGVSVVLRVTGPAT